MRVYLCFFVFLLNSFIFCQGFQLGVNLDQNGAFVNIINQTNRYNNVISFDSLGWPKSDFDLVLMDGRPVPEWTGIIDDPEKYRVDYSGKYKCKFNGQSDVTVSGTAVTIENKNYISSENTTYFELVIGAAGQENHGLVFLKFKNTKRDINSSLNSGITNLIVNRPGYDLNTKKILTDEFINLCKSADFACYRYYGLQNIWDGEPTFPKTRKWEERKTPKDASQLTMESLNGKLDGWSWEYIVELSNILNKDIWININMSCDSIYIKKLAQFLKTNLNPNLNIYVENSNEVWSPAQATHGPYNKAEADYYKITFDQNYARKTVKLSKWFAEVFGQNEINNRIRIILSGQHAYPGRSDNHLNYIKSTFGAPNQYIYALSTALYFGSKNPNSTNPEEIASGMIQDINEQIKNSSSSFYRLNHINKAKDWNFKGGCTSYEGGPSLPEGGGTTNLGNQILAHRTSQMGNNIRYNYLEGWKDLNGGLALYFSLSSAYSRYGCWGITDDYTKPDRNYKMQALRDIINTKYNSIIENDLKFFSINPNPFNSCFSLKFDSEVETDFEISISNTNGINYKNFKIHSYIGDNEFSFNLSNFPSGTYFINLKINDKIYIQKLMKMN